MLPIKIDFPDGSVFHRDMDPNPVRLKDGQFGTKGVKIAIHPQLQAKTRFSNIRSELRHMEVSGKATPEMLDRKRKSLADAESSYNQEVSRSLQSEPAYTISQGVEKMKEFIPEGSGFQAIPEGTRAVKLVDPAQSNYRVARFSFNEHNQIEGYTHTPEFRKSVSPQILKKFENLPFYKKKR